MTHLDGVDGAAVVLGREDHHLKEAGHDDQTRIGHEEAFDPHHSPEKQ